MCRKRFGSRFRLLFDTCNHRFAPRCCGALRSNSTTRCTSSAAGHHSDEVMQSLKRSCTVAWCSSSPQQTSAAALAPPAEQQEEQRDADLPEFVFLRERFWRFYHRELRHCQRNALIQSLLDLNVRRENLLTSCESEKHNEPLKLKLEL